MPHAPSLARAAFFALVLTAVSACTSPAPDTPSNDVALPGPDLGGVVYRCPESVTLERLPGLCVGRIEAPTESILEPFAVLHPTDPDVIVIGANVGKLAAPRLDATAPGLDVVA